jgi:hypothetical protein
VTSQLSEADIESLLRLWPDGLACPVWRLWGESPSFGLLHELRSKAEYEWILRDEGGRAVGLLEVREVSRATRSGYLAFLLPPPVDGAPARLLPFLREALAALELRKITLMADEDMLDALAGVTTNVEQVGLLREHTLATADRYVDRYVFELVGDEVDAVDEVEAG